MPAKKKMSFDLNNITKWSDLFYIDFEISIGLDASRKMISMQNESYELIHQELLNKIKATKQENGNMDENDLEAYLGHLYGIEEHTMSELNRILTYNQISGIFSFFENKLKLVCEKLQESFNLEIIVKSNSVILKYWSSLLPFLEEERPYIERLFTPIINRYTVRNVVCHQNCIADQKQFEQFRHEKSITFNDFENKYYIIDIQQEFVSTLLDQVMLFLEQLLKAIKLKTNQLL
ncbi:hypothetical protein [Flavobacterium sp. ov086]|jgi:hypothetical protein|uniref:hypothetical protein n=1 Tax=Flavobacterium sp. ov086 TaxID=1761785 RepID=UPI000B6D2BB9|nr:hypothetical protein [Flavobacterium sp. ov086]SNR77167.1 hypothetical protein SAMN04487979_12074 [Flavobacterium sp. ov086]